MSWVPVLMTLPLPVLAVLLVYRLMQSPDESFIFLSLRHDDTESAIHLLTVGFLALFALQLYAILPGERQVMVTMLAGSAFTLCSIAALLILNVAVRGPTDRFYRFLPSFWLADRLVVVEHGVSRFRAHVSG